MKKQIWLTAGIAGMLLSTPLLPEARAEVAVNIRVGDPRGPSFVIETWPGFIYLPDHGFSVADEGPYDIILYRNFYYACHNGYWFRARHQRGPWIIVKEHQLPPGIRRHRWEEIRRARDVEYRKHRPSRPEPIPRIENRPPARPEPIPRIENRTPARPEPIPRIENRTPARPEPIPRIENRPPARPEPIPRIENRTPARPEPGKDEKKERQKEERERDRQGGQDR